MRTRPASGTNARAPKRAPRRPPNTNARRSPRSHRLVGALIGLLTAGVALGVAQLAAGFVGGAAAPIVAVGETVVDATPEWLKNFAIRAFGSNDKLVLLIGIGVVLGVAAAALGAVCVRRPMAGVIGLLCLGGLGIIASLTRPGGGVADAIPSIAGTAAGLIAYVGLRSAAGFSPVAWPAPGRRAAGTSSPRARPRAPAPDSRTGGLDRRRFLLAGVAAAAVAGASSLAGRYLIRRSIAAASRADVRIPTPTDIAPLPPRGANLGIGGLGPFITPNDRFYRVDTALFVPAVDAGDWRLRVHGMVDRDLTISYAELLDRPLIERDITLTCVSNPVGGPYAGNARWIGARLKDLLDEAGVRPGANQIVSRSTDGFTVGTPTAVALDGRDSMLAVAMNGQPLPLEHGFPVRMIVPGLYGYVSATKWIVDIELTTFAAFSAYWVRRGWSQQAPIKTESRIDTPASLATVPAGEVPVAGVAWAQHRGIERVEVRVDDGEWMPADLAAQDTVDTWRQWVYRWPATRGRHSLSVRATDDTGATQTPVESDPPPNGATGDHTIVVTVA